MASAADPFLAVMRSRRSVYSIRKELPISEEQVLELVRAAVRSAPSSLGYPTTRVAVLLGRQHEHLWDLVAAALRQAVPASAAEASTAKINASFRVGAGTVLFFYDERATQEVAREVPHESRGREGHFERMIANDCAAAQFVVWTVLSQAGVGVTLQHYQRLVEHSVRAAFRLPPWWRLAALMPFGGIGAAPGEKSYLPLPPRFVLRDTDGLLSGESTDGDAAAAAEEEEL